MTNSFKGLLAVHSAVLIFGLTALFSKLIALTALEITLLRSIFAVFILLAIFFWQKNRLSYLKLKITRLLLYSVCFLRCIG